MRLALSQGADGIELDVRLCASGEVIVLHDDDMQRVGRRPVHLFAGYTYCECGMKMYVRSNCPKYLCQNCNNKIPIVDLDAIFYEQLKGFFVSPEDISEHLAKADENIANKRRLLSGLQAEQSKVQEEISRVYALRLNRKFDALAAPAIVAWLHETASGLHELNDETACPR